MTNQVLASTILEKVGGKENVKSVTHCMTRLRFSLNDIEKANQDELKAMNEIMGVVYKGGQFQLIIGPQVTNLYFCCCISIRERTSERKNDVKVHKNKKDIF